MHAARDYKTCRGRLYGANVCNWLQTIATMRKDKAHTFTVIHSAVHALFFSFFFHIYNSRVIIRQRSRSASRSHERRSERAPEKRNILRITDSVHLKMASTTAKAISLRAKRNRDGKEKVQTPGMHCENLFVIFFFTETPTWITLEATINDVSVYVYVLRWRR